ncbi:MAG: cell division protein SepF [Lachnospiraceae bacterium]|nr:cell division protein SepF [Lachnospiraceae bacterium]
MGFIDGFLDAVNLRDDDYDEDDYDEEEVDEPSRFRRKKRDNDSSDKKVSNITPIRSRQNSSKRASYSAPDEMAVVVIKPTSYNDIQEIADTLLSGRTVVLNTEGLDINVAQRIIDFMSGTCYAIEGAFQKISNFIFIITPKGVEISGDVAQMVDDLSNSINNSGNRF